MQATAVAQRMADEAQARLDAGNTEEYVPEDAPVIDHAHLTDPTAGPDEMWKVRLCAFGQGGGGDLKSAA